ncbi:MAG: MFS transporter, partial [Luteimonas sp.]
MSTPPEPDEPGDTDTSRAAPLRNRNFRALLGYRIFTILSYQIVAVTAGWHIYAETGNPWMLGLIGLAEVLPYFCVAPFAGYLVDHLPRRKLGMAAAAGLAVTPLLLALLTLDLFAHGIWLLYLPIMLTGMVRAFLGPVYNALFARVLPRSQFARGASLGSIVFQSAMVLGPAIG